jgi:hypothetical protein
MIQHLIDSLGLSTKLHQTLFQSYSGQMAWHETIGYFSVLGMPECKDVKYILLQLIILA